MTLTELLPAVRELSEADKLRLIRVLAEELETSKDISPLVPHKLYQLPTPYPMTGAGRALFSATQPVESDRD
jgi:hypothetical protein